MIEKILTKTSGVLTDLSVNLNDYYNGPDSISMTSSDELFISSRFPFNSKYFKVDTVNSVAANMSVQYWDGNQFRDMVEITDETSISGVPLAKSGHVTWVPDRDYGWIRQDTDDVLGLETITVYDNYWLKITFDATVAFSLQWVGQLLTTSNEMGGEFPDLTRTNFYNAFQAGKTDWEEQIVIASKQVIDDLIKRQIILSGNQLLDRFKLSSGCAAKTAELIYSALGDDYTDEVTRVRDRYKERVHSGMFNTDLNNNAREDVAESRTRQGRLRR